jgi:GNAT superfamily N-acetyltransferase
MASRELAIRGATAADAEIVTRLLMAQLAEHRIDTPSDAVRNAVHGALAGDGRAFVLLAERGGRAIGVAYVSFTWALEHGGRSAWLEELYVVPEERNRGAGMAMLAAVLEKAAAAGAAAVDLEVDTGHARAAHLYERAGFRPLSRARWVRSLEPR